MALRIDQGTSPIKATKLPNGFLRVDATITRTGVFLYTNPDGTTRRELRRDSEVFSPESMASFALMPLTDTHPPRFLNAENATDYARGAVGEPRRDGDHVAAQLLVTDAELIHKIEGSGVRELSCGYNCELDMTPGVHPTYGVYDAEQKTIRGNHVAVVKRGRAGPTARVRMDSASVAVVRPDADGEDSPVDLPHNQQQHTPESPVTVKLIRIDGLELDPTSDAFAQAFARLQTKHEDAVKASAAALATAQGEIEKMKAKFDAQAEELTKAQEEIKTLPTKLQASVKARADLETKARKVVGPKFKLDGLDDKAVRTTVLERVIKGFKVDGKTDAYLEARFDAAIEAFGEGTTATTKTAPAAAKEDATEETTTTTETKDAGDAYVAMVTDADEAWKKTLAGVK